MSMNIPVLAAVMLICCTGSALRADGSADRPHVTAWSRELPPVSTNGAAYLTIRNTGRDADRLVACSVAIARRCELHTHENKAGMMVMRRLEGGLTVPADGMITLEPGGHHIMLGQLTEPLSRDKTFALDLTFEGAGVVTVQVRVLSMAAAAERAKSDGRPHRPGGHGHGSSSH